MSLVLTLNAGSSSLKFAVFDADLLDAAPRWRGSVEALGAAPRLRAHDGAGAAESRGWPPSTGQEALLGDLLDWMSAHVGRQSLTAVGHRVVHGGRRFSAPVRVDDDVLQALDALTPLAPRHQPHNLSPIRAIERLRPGVPQVACFDTAFHHAMPEVAADVLAPR